MKLSVMIRCGIAACALVLSAGSVHAQQNYPVKAIRLVTAFAPGGGSDILARLLAPPVSESLGQPVVVDNRPGGGGTLAAGIGVRSVPDGYTLILVSGSYGANAALHELPYDSVTDISPIILLGTTGLLVSFHPSVPIRTMKELIAHARANPGKLNFGSAGVGGLGHLSQEMFRLQAKVNIIHVPYKGSGPVMTALITGEVDSSFSSVVASMPHVKAGRLRAIAVTAPKRLAALPNVATIGETLPGYDVTHWYGIWGAKDIPRDIVLRLNREFAKVLHTEAMRKWLLQEGLEAAGGPPEEFLARIRDDVQKWKKVVKEANIPLAR